MAKEIYIIDNSTEMLDIIRESFQNHLEFKFQNIKTQAIDKALKNIPELIIIHEDGIDIDVVKLCKHIREDEDNSITPVIVISSKNEANHITQVLKQSIEYYVEKPIKQDWLYYTIKNITRLLYVNRRVSPLTGLPGNVQIQAEIKKRLQNKTNFSVLYFDLDNFKAYNDFYGFLKGDEVLKFTGRTIWKNCEDDKDDNFVGHVGGDDFVAILDCCKAETVCQNVIAEFDAGVSVFYNKADLERGYIEMTNRRGIIEEFPLVSISVGIVEVESNQIINILEIGEIGAQLKHAAKAIMGSTYIINKRKE